MAKKNSKVEKREDEGHGYTIGPAEGTMPVYWAPADEDKLGEVREAEVFETEHHAYSCPFRYKNVVVQGWCEFGEKGIEILADRGSITIEERTPIVSVTVVGSGCSGRNYNIVEWWGPGEGLRSEKTMHTQLVKRQRIDNLNGQHPAFTQAALTGAMPDFKTVEEAKAHIRTIQEWVYNMTSGCTMPGSLMSGLFENTAYFRIGDTSRAELSAYKVVVRGGGLDYEDPACDRVRYPADYTFRLIDVVVKKG
ncbi:MAG: hypothetical protein V2A58_00405 [Planctomycetota bacterium]